MAIEWTARPKIIVPIIGRTAVEIREATSLIAESEADIVEWRLDYYFSLEEGIVEEQFHQIRDSVSPRPILVTFRTKSEGGEADLPAEHYRALLTGVSRYADLVDVEYRHPFRTETLAAVHANGSEAVVSFHDFAGKMTNKADLVGLLSEMDAIADVSKVAITPNDAIGVAEFLETAAQFSGLAEKPFILIAMGALGGISRFTGELFGSCATFAALTGASAPGQLSVVQTKLGLDLMSEILGSEKPAI